MVIQITTWSPDTCGCEVSFSWDDEAPSENRVHTFYAIHNVCELHEHLASKTQHSLTVHTAKAQTKMKHIHTITARNMTRHQDRTNQTRNRRQKRELESLNPQVIDHNRRVIENFEDIFAEPYAHDEHIYDLLLKENQTKNMAIGHLEEQHGIANDKVQWRLEGKAPARKVVLAFEHNDHVKIQKSLSARFAERVEVEPLVKE